MLDQALTEEEQMELLMWVDSIPLSRPKRSLARDFSDGVLMAEVVHHYFPRLVELHNYSAAHNSAQKLYNWATLNSRVFKRLGFTLPKEACEAMATCEAGSAERVLRLVRAKMARFQEGQAGGRAGSRNGVGSGATSDPTAAASASSFPAQLQQARAGSPDGAVVDAVAGIRIGGTSPACGSSGSRGAAGGGSSMDAALRTALADREQQLSELRETNEILETKVHKLETLVRLKDAKIQALLQKMAEAAAHGGEGTGEAGSIPAVRPAAKQLQ